MLYKIYKIINLIPITNNKKFKEKGKKLFQAKYINLS